MKLEYDNLVDVVHMALKHNLDPRQVADDVEKQKGTAARAEFLLIWERLKPA